ncbi:DUF917 family protein [Rhizobium sp. BK650]|uniref:S-methyl thiohydantoin desulfurase domain-containing protein n=1 Tax=Rhizobium sp. BK650 TaxID=2586990 RepID=UPI001815AC07|nr:DUF917 family protein [Rhizobium sp. BK650]MBB3660836.1 DUF917 family protein [Rhizobium sp. BK650]
MVHRPRILDNLLARKEPIVVLDAPAGMGKTAALIEIAAYLGVDFQNEFLMAERDGDIICTTPDLITLLEAESGAPVTADSLRYGLRLVALAFPCNPQWQTPAGIALVGPRYFGYDTDYRPYPFI